MTRTGPLLLWLFTPALVISTLACGGAPPAPTREAAASANAVGIDTAGMDRAVPPGDDFFAFANGTWIRGTEIPPDRAAWGINGELAAQAERDNRAILEHAASAPSSPEEKKLGDFYAAYMDEQTIEQRGLTPLQPTLDRIAAIGNRQALAREFGTMLRADVDPLNFTSYHTDNLFGLWVTQDFNQPTRNTAYFFQGGLAMPDREYYVGTSDRMQQIRETYAAHVATVLRLAGASGKDATQQAARIIALETKIARTHATREQSVDVLKANNPWSRDEFPKKAPGLDWPAFFDAATLNTQPSFVVWHPAAVTGISALVASQPLDDWKLYLRYIVVNGWSPLLPKAFADESFAFFGTTLSGTPQQSERWKRGVRAADAMGDALGRLYVQQHFPPESKQAIEAMVADIKSAFAARIERLDWMTPATKARATEKLHALIVGVGYPEQRRDYSGLEVSREDAIGNAMRADLYYYRERVAKLSKPIDRNEWWMTPQTVNAVNLPIQNALNFPAAYLQPPHFDPRANAASNYAMIGSVIGHEISHSFDDQGAQFDATGRLANWWTKEDAAHFSAVAEQLVTQFNGYKPFPDLAVNGRQTLSENIADLAGVAAAYDAYRLSLHGKELPAQDGFAGDQQFFIAFAQNWRTKMRDEMLRRIIITDGHAPAQYRPQTVRNLDAWYAAFNIKPGAALYLEPAKRVRIW
ncbi:MAG: M13 family metallopeptidase [Acidobacteria bacterium]|nr:M13 family metallopeptidase [Acidobacteriota bacterium]